MLWCNINVDLWLFQLMLVHQGSQNRHFFSFLLAKSIKSSPIKNQSTWCLLSIFTLCPFTDEAVPKRLPSERPELKNSSFSIINPLDSFLTLLLAHHEWYLFYFENWWKSNSFKIVTASTSHFGSRSSSVRSKIQLFKRYSYLVINGLTMMDNHE